MVGTPDVHESKLRAKFSLREREKFTSVLNYKKNFNAKQSIVTLAYNIFCYSHFSKKKTLSLLKTLE